MTQQSTTALTFAAARDLTEYLNQAGPPLTPLFAMLDAREEAAWNRIVAILDRMDGTRRLFSALDAMWAELQGGRIFTECREVSNFDFLVDCENDEICDDDHCPSSVPAN